MSKREDSWNTFSKKFGSIPWKKLISRGLLLRRIIAIARVKNFLHLVNLCLSLLQHKHLKRKDNGDGYRHEQDEI